MPTVPDKTSRTPSPRLLTASWGRNYWLERPLLRCALKLASGLLIGGLLAISNTSYAGEIITYRSNDSSLKGEFCRPSGSGPFPAVIYNHGGIGTQLGGAPAETCAALAAAGYAGFAPIRRLTSGLGGHLDDVMTAVDHVKALPGIDPDRIAIVGFSRGGLLTFQAASRRTDLRAVVILAPASGGSSPGGLNLKDAASIAAPSLLLVAQNDTGSRRSNDQNTLHTTREMADALKKAGKDTRLIVYPPFGGDGHLLFFSVGSYWPDVVEFLKRHL